MTPTQEPTALPKLDPILEGEPGHEMVIAYEKQSVHALLEEIEAKIKCIERDLHEQRIPACGIIAVDAWNLMEQIREARR